MVPGARLTLEEREIISRGHWEGDLLLGRSDRSQVDVIVERSSRFVQLVALPENRKAATVRDAIAENTNRLLRQYLPRKLDFSTLSQEELDRIAAERFSEFVATTG